MSEPFIPVIKGPVQAVVGGTYLRREADEDLYKACKLGKFAYILASRQIGKSSLMFETARKLNEDDFKTVMIDLNNIGQNVNADIWYFSLLKELANHLNLDLKVQLWWDERERLSASTQRFLEFLREVVLKKISGRIVIFIDEIDVTLGMDFTDDFFAAIRAIYNDRAQYSEYKRLTFVLLGAATPDELIRDNTRTPFNIGQAINLGDFTKQECEMLRQAVKAKYPDQGQRYFDQIYEWTHGHPYLTQKLSAALLNTDMPAQPKADTNLVNNLVTKLFLASEDREDNHIEIIQNRMGTDLYAREMLNTYKRMIYDKEPVTDDEKSPAINRLKLYGLVVAQGGKLEVRNNLYARVFNPEWIERMLKNLTKKLGLPGRYRIIQQIGSGAFATVYLAEETQESSQEKRTVALKVLQLQEQPEASLDEIIKRFKQEAETLAKLKHHNIITTFETNQSETGRNYEKALYIAMEYISGGSLRQRLDDNGRLYREQAIDIIKQVGGALSHAHKQDIIHRDVNPNNILLDTNQEPLRPVLTDFGLVKLLSSHQNAPIQSTRPVGTFPYMAPEQFNEDLIPTPAIDIYALAITLFEMLTGQRPVKQAGKTTIPSLSSVISEIGPFFDDILVKATAEKSADRYQSMNEFINAVEAANEQAIKQEIKREQAAQAIYAARGYARNNPQIALKLIEPVLDDYPGYVEALRLRGEIERNKGEYPKALATYEQAYQQECNPDSETGRDYLDLLREVSTTAWKHKKYQEALKQYKVIRHLLNEGRQAGFSVKQWDETVAELVDDHQKQGEVAFAIGNPDNLAESLTILSHQIEAMKVLEAAEAVQDLENKLKLLQIKRYYDEGEVAYANGEPADITEAIQILQDKIKQLVELNATSDSQKLGFKLSELEIKQQFMAGVEVYNQANLNNLTKIIQSLDTKIKMLEELSAAKESQELKDKKQSLEIKLQIQEFKNSIKDEEAFLSRDNPQDEAIFQHYSKIDEVYQNLIRLEPDNEQWRQEQRQKLKERAGYRLNLAQRAEHEAKYEMALGHYRWIIELDQKFNELTRELVMEPGSKSLIQELGLNDFPQKISHLEKVANYDRKYKDIQSLVGQKEFSKALDFLNEDFIHQGYYEYKDTAKLLWGAVYAKQNDGQTPPEWAADISLKNLEWRYTSFKRMLKVSTPLALLGAIILGIIIGYYFQILPEPTRTWGLIGFVLVMIYFLWYIWTHYGSKIRL